MVLFAVGDLAGLDADGYFWMTGRKKELIIRGGHNIDPKMIEEAMHANPDIVLAAAIGRPDEKAGELPVLYYQSTTGRDVPPQDLAAYAQDNIPERASLPKAFIRLDELPLTAIGKVHKPTLNMLEIERTIRAEAEAVEATIDSLEVTPDSQRGIIARLKAGTGQDNLARRLGNYEFAVEFKA